MARIRSIKPEFWTSEQVMECSPIARLLFIGMWNFADDLGRLPLSAKTLKAMIFPSDDMSSDTILGMIQELSRNGLILPYVVEGREYLQITGWQHQRIDKPQPGKYPGPVNGYSENVRGMVATEGKGEEEIGREGIEEPSLRSGLSETKISDPPQRKRKGYPEQFESFWSAYPTDPNMSKKEAFDVWARLTPDDHSQAIASLTAFKEFCAKDPTYRPIHACRYLSKRRFEGHGSAPCVNGSSPQGPPPELEGKALADWVHEQRRKRDEAARTAHSNPGNLLDRGEEVRRGHDQGPPEPALVRTTH